MGQRRTFSREFKLEAVKLVRERGVSVARRRVGILICTRTCCGSGCGSKPPIRGARSRATAR